MPLISVIIPCAPDENEEKALIDLLKVQSDIEIIVASSSTQKSEDKGVVKYIKSPLGRAQAMNAGAKVASAEFLWFLHADSQLTQKNIQSLKDILKVNSKDFYYFDLRFDKALPQMKLNNFGVWFRSHILGVPFGDQGFCLQKKYFKAIGTYPENVPYGEDHLLVWYARQYGLKLVCTGTKLVTSSRRYQKHGWLKITGLYQYRWIKQAFPEWIKLLNIKFGKGEF